ncbi:MAG: ferritin family protein [Sedimentisphaeraceae bacterium JB056]
MTLREILEVAVQMEADGIKFYAKAAENAPDEKSKELLLSLSSWESKHYEQFSKIKDEVVASSEAIVSPDGQASLYLEAFVTGAVFDANANPFEYLNKDTEIPDILKIAISLEKDAVCCYSGIKMMVADEQSKSKVDQIIKEEMEHIKILSDLLKEQTVKL